MSYLSKQSNHEYNVHDDYTYLLFEKEGEYVNSSGQKHPALEFVRVLDPYFIFSRGTDGNPWIPEEDKYVIKVVSKEHSSPVEYLDVIQRRKDLEILSFLTTYGNLGDVYNADDMKTLESQLHFGWRELLDNYTKVLGDNSEENNVRNKLMKTLHRLSSGNMQLTIQDFINSVNNGFHADQKKISGYLRKFADEGFIVLTDYFTIRPGTSATFTDDYIFGKGKKWA